MRNLKTYLLIAVTTAVTGFFNACSETSFSSADAASVQKVSGDGDNTIVNEGEEEVIPVEEVDTEEEVEYAEENYECQRDSANNVKVLICHIPPSGNAHEICVSIHAQPAFINSKINPVLDYLGHCQEDPISEQDDESSNDDESSTDA